MKRLFPLVIFLITAAVAGAAARDSVQVRFRQSHTVLDRAFGRNAEALDSFYLRLAADSSARRLVGLRVSGAASPEGSVAFNNYLSEHRAMAIFNDFKAHGTGADSIATHFTFLGRDWQGLRRAVEADGSVPYRTEVLELLGRITSAHDTPADPLHALKALRGGVPYLYMYRSLFPGLRESWLVAEYTPAIRHLSVPAPEIPTSSLEFAPPAMTLTAVPAVKRCRPFYMGLKTNMLYDAALLPNIGAEFYIGKNWSLMADWMYGWWDRDRTHHYWRAYGGTIGARCWFGAKAEEKPLTGHHLGAFAGVVTYDFELGGRGYMGGLPGRTLWDRCNFICGIEYGYSLPVARRLNIDFTIGVGYLGGKVVEYVPNGEFYEWQRTRRLNWVGPTKAEIALVWLIGCDNYNRRRGSRP